MDISGKTSGDNHGFEIALQTLDKGCHGSVGAEIREQTGKFGHPGRCTFNSRIKQCQMKLHTA